MNFYTNALEYHQKDKPGKLEIQPTKPLNSIEDLSYAYSPGVAAPCLEIFQDANAVFRYTSKGNLVGVISNGSAVLGLGNIGPLASKPVMEGKAILFKKLAGIDAFDLELKQSTPERFIEACEMLEPTFGGINLEDIKAPECFFIEQELKKRLKIPVFHDDQHGTAIVSAAAFLNALQLTGKRIQNIRLVFSGSGAAAIACARSYLLLGVQAENIFMADSKGLLYEGRQEGMNPFKQMFARKTSFRTIAEALEGADAFIGVSVKNSITKEMVATMAPNPIIFAMANPDPEIMPSEVKSVRSDAIIATGRSDYPNQVNNILGFPFIFRGALDTQATEINEPMKEAAIFALANLAQQPIPDSVRQLYPQEHLSFGKEYLIPKPFDPRVMHTVAPAVAEAAIRSGVAQKFIDITKYQEDLKNLSALL